MSTQAPVPKATSAKPNPVAAKPPVSTPPAAKAPVVTPPAAKAPVAKAPVVTPPAAKAPTAKVYANCAALNVDYPHGVGRPGAIDHTAKGKNPVTNFTVNATVYNANPNRDGDKDGIACEQH